MAQKPTEIDKLLNLGLNITCMLPINSAKRIRPKMASAMENIDSPGNVLV